MLCAYVLRLKPAVSLAKKRGTLHVHGNRREPWVRGGFFWLFFSPIGHMDICKSHFDRRIFASVDGNYLHLPYTVSL